MAALSLKFLNPYGTNKIVLFEVRYTSDWHIFELFVFVFLGMCGGVYGAFFIKASKFWATTFRRNKFIKTHPVLELSLVALATGLISYWNRYVKLAVSELLFELASPCSGSPSNRSGLCPKPDEIPSTILYLLVALAIKSVLTYDMFPSPVLGLVLIRLGLLPSEPKFPPEVDQYFCVIYAQRLINSQFMYPPWLLVVLWDTLLAWLWNTQFSKLVTSTLALGHG